jgi:hypothetical protein
MAAEAADSMAAGAVDSMAAGAVDFMAAVDSTVAASGDLAEVGVDLAGVAGGVVAGVVGGVVAGVVGGVVAGVADGVTQAGDAAGVGVIPVGAGGLASALVGAGVPIGEGTRTRMDIPIIIRTIRTTQTMGRTGMRRRTRIAITVPAEIRVTTRSGKIQTIPHRRDRLA